MKLKVLILIFNIILVIIFLTVFSFSLFSADTDFIGNFFKNYWLFIGSFFFLLIGINLFFLNNRNLISSLEAENWSGLSQYLETEILKKRHLSFRKVRLFSEICILLADFDNLRQLETVLEADKPRFLRKLATRFAAGKMLTNDYESLASFSKKIIAQSGQQQPWMHFYEAFAEQMLKNYTAAAQKYEILLRRAYPPLSRLLALYFLACGLHSYSGMPPDEIDRYIASQKAFLKKYSSYYWEKQRAKEKHAMHILVLTKTLNEALEWLSKEEGRFNQQH